MAHGGKRVNAGRPKGRGKYGEETVPLRIPYSKLNEIKRLIENPAAYHLPLYGCTVKAGFPSPADDYIETYLDLNTHLIQHPSATFFLKASGDSMINAGINSGDLLIVDRSVEATHDKIVIAAIDGELTVKRLSKTAGRIQLLPENDNYPAIDITSESDLIIWGVVTFVIHTAT